ncbi:MAG: DksA/TraR family C4-type zinc finger protein [Pararhodobacter sp.]
MAGGWAKDGDVEAQIEASIGEELARLRARTRQGGAGLTHCADCDEEIPEARRAALPGVTLCLDCQQERDHAFRSRPGINRRGSKDSQMK